MSGQSVEQFANEAEGFATELVLIKRDRLESINIYDAKKQNASACPICFQELTNPTPRARAIIRSLNNVSQNLESTTREEPR